MVNDLVSIITPVYNKSGFIKQTINSVQKQTYKNWEMIIVDDCSTDGTSELIKEILQKDDRIKYIKLKNNSGAAVARNKALSESRGRFIAYLDADDMWKENKIQKQIDFMITHDYAFVCSDYEKIDINNKILKQVKIPEEIDYKSFLRNTIIQTVGVMIDSEKTGRELLVMPNIYGKEDAATWCQLLKSGFNCHRVPEFLSYYRVVPKSLSSNKIKAIKGTWFLYRKIEKLSLANSCICFLGYAINAIKKRIYIMNNDANEK